MKLLALKYKHFLFLLLIFIISEIIVNPIGNFPLNDDWSYGKAVFYTLNKSYTIGSFGAMTLFTHLMWGALFTKIFGFSFTVLRISTLISALIGLFFLNKLVVKITNNQVLGFLSCLVLLFNPLFFNLTNTYMTDVNFNTLLVMCCYFAYNFFETKSNSSFILFFITSILLVLIRQFGIVVPLCFLVACLFIKEKRGLPILFSLLGVCVVYFIFKFYENYLSTILPSGSSYKFSNDVHITEKRFWDLFFWNFEIRHKPILVHIFLYTSPIAIIFLKSLVKDIKLYVTITVFLVSTTISFWVFQNVEFPHHNVFENMFLGAETFRETLTPIKRHSYSEGFATICDLLKWILPAFTLTTILLYLILLIRKRFNFLKIEANILFLLGLLISYIFLILITESYFDRYHIPLITVTLILLVYINRDHTLDFKVAIIPLLCFFYVSVFGTKDYLTLNRTRWDAYNYIKEKANTNAEKINGGFEVNCWNDGKENWWYNYDDLNSFDYLIQFKKEDGFVLLKPYEFQRYFPYKKDTLKLFVRESTLVPNPGK